MAFLMKYKWWILSLIAVMVGLFVVGGWKIGSSVSAVSIAILTGTFFDEKLERQEKIAIKKERQFMRDLKKRSIRIEQDRKKEVKKTISKNALQDQKDDLMEDIDDV